MNQLALRLAIALLGVLVIQEQNDGGPPRVADFSEHSSGSFAELVTPVGRFLRVAGETRIDPDHGKVATPCLQLSGNAEGQAGEFILELADEVDRTGDLHFWAERWTSRGPFEFWIEKETPQGWQEIYRGDRAVRVGRSFLNKVVVPLRDGEIGRLKFHCKSPVGTGILLDDMNVVSLTEQKIVSVEPTAVTLPVLVGDTVSPVVAVEVDIDGQLKPIAIDGIQMELIGNVDPDKILKLELYLGGATDHPLRGKPVFQVARPFAGGPNRAFSLSEERCQLDSGKNRLWIACQLASDTDIDQRLGLKVQSVRFSNGESRSFDGIGLAQRIGIALRKGGDDDCHTFRIPGLATTREGTLIAVYDIRYKNGSDLPGDIDVGMSRSTDGGRSWEPMKVIMDQGDLPEFQHDGVGDPAVLVDRFTGTIWVAGLWSHGNRAWHGSGPGQLPEETGQLLLVRSDDDGVTWSNPINITSQVKDAAWSLLLQGPGKGITMQDGTLVFAAQFRTSPNDGKLPYSTILYSRDHGKTWGIGTGAFPDTTEAQVVEVEPGVLMLNCRYNRKSTRVVMTTKDMGKTWQKHPTSETALIEPRACMASLIDVRAETPGSAGHWLLFSNPNSLIGRQQLTIKASADRGQTWPEAHQLLLDEGKSAGYSCLTMIDQETIGILYEGSQAHMTFQRIPLKELTQKPSQQ